MTTRQISAEPTLTIRRTFAAPRARVFAAWTDVDLVRQWFAPDGRITDLQWDPRDGAAYRIAMTMPNDEEFIATGVFSDVRAPERLAFTFRWQEDDPAEERDTYITVELVDRGSETEMVFTHNGFRDDASRDRHIEGWTAWFDNLARTLS